MNRSFSFLFVFLFYLNGPGSNFAQTAIRSEQDYALFFAVNDYQHLNDLQNPIKNAREIAKELADKYAFSTEVIENPTFNDIANKINEYQHKFADNTFDQKGQLLLFFSGHGVKRGNNGYFIPADGNPDRLYEKVIEYDYWRNEIDRIDCRHILVTIDACQSLTFDPNWRNKTDREFGRKGEKDQDQVLLDHEKYRSRHFFTSDATGDETPDRSTFARQFLLALRTYRPTAGYLSADELYAIYLKKAAPVPGGGDFGRDEPGSRFLFFPVKPKDVRNTAADLATWEETVRADSCGAYRNYLEKFPEGDFASKARRILNNCDAQYCVLVAWEDAKSNNDCNSYKEFIGKYPNSSFAVLVQERLRLLDCLREYKKNNLTLIPGGTFKMGNHFVSGMKDEKPPHRVQLNDFYLNATEVTIEEFAAFVNDTGYFTEAEKNGGSNTWTGSGYTKKVSVTWRDDAFGVPQPPQNYDHPVVHVSWYDAVAYCNWLSIQHGYLPVYLVNGFKVVANWEADGYRLPTEAEWEYAARNKGEKERWSGTSYVKNLLRYANLDGSGDGYTTTAPVGELKANELGISDLSGNVWEWCWDWYGEKYYAKSPAKHPDGPPTGRMKVIRGGSWLNDPKLARNAIRNRGNPSLSSCNIGFRVARNGQ